MKTKTLSCPRRLFGVLALTALVLLLGACREKRLVWSPDGTRAAVISSEGLHLCDADGNLSAALAPNIKLAAWLPDSRQLVLLRTREVRDWAALAPALGEARQAFEAKADDLWQKLQAGSPWSVLSMDLKGRKSVSKIFLRDRHGQELKARLTEDEWKELESTSTSVSELLMARSDGDGVILGQVFRTHHGDVLEIRPSRNGKVVAWTEESIKGDNDDLDLMIALLEGTPVATRVARHTAGYPDWHADGRSLVYVESPRADGPQPDDAIVLGVLTRRGVLNGQGVVELDPKPEYLGGLFFSTFTHVRCLRDGRVLFNAAEMSLPMASADFGGDQREQLFALDPGRQSTLVRIIPRRQEPDLPQAVAFFEVSPDEQQVVINGMKNEVAVLTLATGEVKRIQEPMKDAAQGVPTWRSAGEFTYVKQTDKGSNSPLRPAEIMLRRGDKEFALSRTWADSVLDAVTSGGNK